MAVMPQRRRLNGGFTLIEVIVVMVIIAAVFVGAVLIAPERVDHDRLENEARRLHQLLRIAAEDAVIKGEDYGIEITGPYQEWHRTEQGWQPGTGVITRILPRGYRFLVLGNDGWSVPEQPGPLRAREMEASLLLDAQIEGEAVDFKPAARGRLRDEDKVRPHALILSDGSFTPFVLEVRAAGIRYWYEIEGDLAGELTLNREDAEGF